MAWVTAGWMKTDRVKQHRFAIRLRGKLLLVSLALLAIPWAGYQYVREMEQFLRDSKQVVLADNVRAVATVMHNRRELFSPRGDITSTLDDESNIYARKLNSPIQLDGYLDDWGEHVNHARYYADNALIHGNVPYRESSLSFRHVLGHYEKYYYMLFDVMDDHVVYRAPNSLRLDKSDHILIAMQAPGGEIKRYILTTQAPGWVNAHELGNDPGDFSPVRPEVRIKGEWQETSTGYILELRIPQSIMTDRLSFALVDVDDPVTRTAKYTLSTTGAQRLDELGTVLTASPDIEKILAGLNRGNSRTWVINRNRHVLALAGSLTSESTGEDITSDSLLAPLYRLILKQPSNSFDDELEGASRLEGKDIQSALSGSAKVSWRRTPDERAVILSASHPVWDNGEVIGAVIVEQTSNDILTLQNKALESLLNVTLVVFLSASLFLLIFATRLSSRIRKLHREAEQSIGSDGRVQGCVTASSSTDEIGDLSRSFSDMIARLQEYTRYLESMASKLSHELRTPLAVVMSSLDNLDMENLPPSAQPYTQRAREGIQRLALILNSMNEATRLEQSLQSSEDESFNLVELVSGCVEGYRLAYPLQQFRLDSDSDDISMTGYPDRLAQMLDKLANNAVDFSTPGEPIIIGLSMQDKNAIISVQNSGPLLPETMQGQLFDSMVSVREKKSDNTHLGIGLFIVRLIAEFHNGTVSASNLADNTGVLFSVKLPVNQQHS